MAVAEQCPRQFTAPSKYAGGGGALTASLPLGAGTLVTSVVNPPEVANHVEVSAARDCDGWLIDGFID